MKTQLESHQAQHDEMTGQIAEAHNSLASKLDDHSKGRLGFDGGGGCGQMGYKQRI